MTRLRFTLGRNIAAAGVIALLMVAPACGDDDDDGGTTGPDDTSTTTAANQTTDASCSPLPYSVSLKAAKGSDVGLDDSSFQVMSAKAVKLAGGAGYTIYLANYELTDAEVSSAVTAPKPAAGKTLVTVAVTTFNAQGTPPVVKEGDVIPYTPDFNKLTFRVITQVGEKTFSSSATAKGNFTVSATGDSICGEIDYEDFSAQGDTDAQNRLKGPISAKVVREF